MIFTQTDTSAGCSAAEDKKTASVGGTAGVTAVSNSSASDAVNAIEIEFRCDLPAGSVGDTGTWNVRLNCTAANMNLTWTGIDFLQYNSACTLVNSSTLHSVSHSLATTGVKTSSITGVKAFTLSAGDFLSVLLRITNGAMSAQSFEFTPNQNIDSPFTSASAALTGTIQPSVTEADIVTGGKTAIITLTGDTWIAAGAASFDLQRDEIIAGFDSAQSEALGWDLVPKALQSLAGVVRTSDTVVTVTWDAFATYDITATETITVTVPGTAVTLGNAIVATPTFTVSATAGAAKLLMLLGVGT